MREILNIPASKALKLASSRGTEYVVLEGGRLHELTPAGSRPISRAGVIKKATESTFCEYVSRAAAEATVDDAHPGERLTEAHEERHRRQRPQTGAQRVGSRAPPERPTTADATSEEPPVVAHDDGSSDADRSQPVEPEAITR